VDGELPEGEARRVADMTGSNKEAQAVVAELRMTKSILNGNEPDAKLPESREFYWSKIQREIERLEKAEPETRRVAWVFAWRRLLAPLSGMALIAFLSVLSLNLFHGPAVDDSLKYLVEVENLSEDVGSISYKSQSENMFVVYLYNKDQEPESDIELEPLGDTVIQ
jgi:anti-sigma factor RsiW